MVEARHPHEAATLAMTRKVGTSEADKNAAWVIDVVGQPVPSAVIDCDTGSQFDVDMVLNDNDTVH